MGRGVGQTTKVRVGTAPRGASAATAVNAPKLLRRPLIEEPLLGVTAEHARRFLDYKSKHFHIEYITSPGRLRRARQILLSAPEHGFDIETNSYRGWGVANGAPRLLQFGIDTPETGPYQAVVDLRYVNPAPLFAVLKDRDLCTAIQNYDFELQWMYYHFGVQIKNPYDTKLSSAEIRSTLKREFVNEDRWDEAPEWAHQMYPDGFIKRDNRLDTICEDTLGFRIPKAGLQNGDWGASRLPARLIVYAGGDPAVTLSAAQVLRRRCQELGIEDKLQKRFMVEPQQIWKRVSASPARSHDDSEAMILAMRRAKSIPELERLLASSRQAAIFFTNRRLLNKTYRLQKNHLLQS